jgi:signal transduction histidine kinase
MRSDASAESSGGLPVEYADLSHIYHLLRAVTATTIVGLAIALALLWGRPELIWVGVAALVAVVDAHFRLRRSEKSPLLPIALDTVALGVAMIFGGLPLPVMGAPLAYLVTAAVLLLPPRRALGTVFHAGLWVLAALAVSPTSAVPWTPDQALVLGGLATAIFFTEMTVLAWEAAGILRERQQTLQALLRSKDELIASVSHEIRTPLTAVIGFARELRERRFELDAVEETEMLDLIVSEAQEVADIVDDLLVAARLKVGILSFRPERVRLDACARDVLHALGDEWAPVRLEGTGTCYADPLRLRQILRNLLTNAQRYGGSEITVAISQNGPSAHLEVMDNGLGIPAPDIDRVFQPYEQAHDDKGQPHSVGLGLYVGRELARLMDGDLTYERRGEMTVFNLSLPIEHQSLVLPAQRR